MKYNELISVMHSKRLFAQPPDRFKTAFDVTKLKLTNKRLLTEPNKKTDQGTCTTEDESQDIQRPTLMNILCRRDIQFTQSPLETKLNQYQNQQVTINIINLNTLQNSKSYGYVNSNGHLSYIQELKIISGGFLYVTLRNRNDCIYYALIQGNLTTNKLREQFLNLLGNLIQNEPLYMTCYGCQFQFLQIFVWNLFENANWILIVKELKIKHNKYCLNRPHRRLNKSIRTDTQGSSFFLSIDSMADFLKPSSVNRESDRINQICIRKCQQLRPKSSSIRTTKRQKPLTT